MERVESDGPGPLPVTIPTDYPDPPLSDLGDGFGMGDDIQKR